LQKNCQELQLSLGKGLPEEILIVTGSEQVTTFSNWSADSKGAPENNHECSPGEPKNHIGTTSLFSSGGKDLPRLKSMKRSLEKNGFHREIKTVVSISQPETMNSSVHQEYVVALVEILPESVFVDKYQVNEIHRLG